MCLPGLATAKRDTELEALSIQNKMETAMTIVLSPLPYAQDALAPHISADTLATHPGKHHKAYVDKVNAAIEGTDLAGKSLAAIIHHEIGRAPCRERVCPYV